MPEAKKIIKKGGLFGSYFKGMVLALLWEDFMVDGITMAGVCVRGRDHMARQEAQGGASLVPL
jgi:hypothetical protein